MRTLLDEHYEKCKKEALKDWDHSFKICLFLDIWTSPNCLAFMAVLAYFISSDWRYQSVLIDFIPVPECHDRFNLVNHVLRLIQKYGIEEKILTITANNVKNNITMMKVLGSLIRRLENEWDSETNLILCLTHVLHLAVKSILDDLDASSKNDKMIKIYDEELNSVSNDMLNDSPIVSHTLTKVSFLTVLFHSLS